MTTTQRLFFIFSIISFPLLVYADNVAAKQTVYDIYSSVSLFFALTGMLLLMFAPTRRLLCGIIGAINLLVGLPVIIFMFNGSFTQTITGPVLSLLIGTMMLIRLIGIGTKKETKSPGSEN